jgi:mRNA interferase RelE/StbE
LGQIDCVDVRDAQDNRLGTRPTGSESKDEIDFLINRAIDIISQSTTIIRTATVEITPAARGQISVLPLPIQVRVFAVIERLVNWPNASGARPLRAKLKGNFRIRTGDYRVIFHYTKPVDTVTVWKIGYRGDIYD